MPKSTMSSPLLRASCFKSLMMLKTYGGSLLMRWNSTLLPRISIALIYKLSTRYVQTTTRRQQAEGEREMLEEEILLPVASRLTPVLPDPSEFQPAAPALF